MDKHCKIVKCQCNFWNQGYGFLEQTVQLELERREVTVIKSK